MIVLLDKELADGSLSRNTCKLAEKVLKKKSHATHAKTQLSDLLGSKDEPLPALREIRMGIQQQHAG